MPFHKLPHYKGSFFGRRKGRPLRPMQQNLLENLLDRLRLDLSVSPPTKLSDLFADPVEKIHLEIGFGGGEHLLDHATRQPHIGFIGVEPFINGMAKLLAGINNQPDLAHHIRLYDDDATHLLDWLPTSSLDGVDLFYPDPWRKKKHFKRRFVNRDNLARLARVLKSGGRFRFCSDIASYVEWTVQHVRDQGDFIILSPNEHDWLIPYPSWFSTRYEAKALREGRTPCYLTFHRI